MPRERVTIPENITREGLVVDALRQPLRDLRISVTDRCNFRCSYCMPKEVFGRDYAFLPQSSLLSFEEITRAARVAVGLGVRKMQAHRRRAAAAPAPRGPGRDARALAHAAG